MLKLAGDNFMIPLLLCSLFFQNSLLMTTFNFGVTKTNNYNQITLTYPILILLITLLILD